MAETDIRLELADTFATQAEWRRSKADEYPDDSRNLEAAELLDKLATSTKDIDLKVLQAYRELLDGFDNVEHHSEMIGEIGFHSWPETAEEFCREYIADRTGV
ncbi:MAG: hypothetical protein IIB62_13060 [Proteobacteria bacterium]|nr:hypothetical protein [Pseudomonadota bacterium]